MVSTIIKKDYFHGIGKIIAGQVGCSADYARNVLNGVYGDRDTLKTREILAAAEKLMEATSIQDSSTELNKSNKY